MRNRPRSLVDPVVAVLRDYALNFPVVGLPAYALRSAAFVLGRNLVDRQRPAAVRAFARHCNAIHRQGDGIVCVVLCQGRG